MRTLAATLAVGVLVAIAVSRVAAGFLPDFAMGMAYMFAAAIVINSRRGSQPCAD